MVRAACLTLLGLAACQEDVETRQLADMPGLKVSFSATPALVFVEIIYDRAELACGRLHGSFRATVGDTEVPIAHPGGLEGVACIPPNLKLEDPPAAESIVVEDDSRRIVIEVGDRLMPRSMQLVPDGPWIFASGYPVRVRYAPATDLSEQRVSLRYLLTVTETDVVRDVLPFTVSGEELSFEAPRRSGKGRFEVYGGGGREPWPCGDATCELVEGLPWLLQSFEIRAN